MTRCTRGAPPGTGEGAACTAGQACSGGQPRWPPCRINPPFTLWLWPNRRKGPQAVLRCRRGSPGWLPALQDACRAADSDGPGHGGGAEHPAAGNGGAGPAPRAAAATAAARQLRDQQLILLAGGEELRGAPFLPPQFALACQDMCWSRSLEPLVCLTARWSSQWAWQQGWAGLPDELATHGHACSPP